MGKLSKKPNNKPLFKASKSFSIECRRQMLFVAEN